jgi:type II secretory pathway component PulC
MRTRRWFGLSGVIVAMLGLAAGVAPALAESMTRSDATVVVRAWGQQSSLKRVPRSERSQGPRPLSAEVNAGVIPRDALKAELANGIGRFLQQVRTQPVVSRGRFVGWRLMTLFPSRGDIHVSVLKPGDTVLRVNGQSVERPEEFKALWDSLASASQLVLEIERDGEASSLRYTIQ